jgi:hypothetical protein
MHAFDAPLHGKSINLRDFSHKYDHGARAEDAVDEDGHADHRQRQALWHALPVVTAIAMTLVHGQQGAARDWGPEADLLTFFLAAFLPLRIFARLRFPEKGAVAWPSLALHSTVMLCAYPYDTERVSVVVFCAVLLCVGFYTTRCVPTRSLALNAFTLLVILNAVLCLMVYANDSRLVVAYYHVSFSALCVLLVFC